MLVKKTKDEPDNYLQITFSSRNARKLMDTINMYVANGYNLKKVDYRVGLLTVNYIATVEYNYVVETSIEIV